MRGKAQKYQPHWTVEQDARLIRLFNFGWALPDVAIQMRRTESSIRNRLGRLRRRGLVGRRRPPTHGRSLDQCRVCNGAGWLPAGRAGPWVRAASIGCVICGRTGRAQTDVVRQELVDAETRRFFAAAKAGPT